ncbi:hypothetical protein [Sporosarcina sp. SAFN-015]|uniref:hypothetical protein n=1 Tax=Sporosarcina sp. SAFN-015 TaxID=3387274 RepID=UPI003F814E22
MKQWNGLLHKEWVQWRGQIIVLVILLLAGLFILPSLAKVLAIGEISVFEITMAIGFIAAGACILVPVIAFSMMFNKDMKRPDIWFHSTASTVKLVGVKMLMSAGMGLAYLLATVLVVAIRYAITPQPEAIFNELLFYGSLLIIGVFLASIQFMVYGFFFIVIDQLLKPFLKGFSFVVTLILFIISARIYGEVTGSNLYDKFIRVGSFDLMSLKNPVIDLQYDYFTVTNTVLYAGEIIFAVLFTVGLFYLAIALFEKRVRL